MATPNPHANRGGARFSRPVEKPKNSKNSLKRMLSYFLKYKGYTFSIIFIVIIYSILTVVTNVFIKKVVASMGSYNIETNSFEILPNEKEFGLFIILLSATYLLIVIFRYLMTLLSTRLSAKIVQSMRSEVFNKLVYLPISYLDSHPHGDLMSRITNDVDNVYNMVSSSLTSLISGVVIIIGCLGVMIFYSPLLTLVSLVVLGLTLLLTLFMSKVARPLYKKQQEALGLLNSETEENVMGIKTVKAYNYSEYAIKTFNKYSDELTKAGTKASIIGGSMGPVMNFIGNLSYFLISLFGALLVINKFSTSLTGELISVSIVVTFLTTTKQFSRPINEIAQQFSSIVSSLAAAERIFELLDEKSENFESKTSLDETALRGNIKFEHVYFGYKEDKLILKDIDIEIYSGHKITLVGATGSGKTTIVNLLLRFYDVNQGKIKIDDIDINDLSKKDLRKIASIVLQDPVLFASTIKDNIKYGKEDATEEEIQKSLKAANCDYFIEQLPDGINTVLNEGATNISQGQKQLLTIARALIADPKILILDEATSSVDTRTEKEIQDALANLMKDRTSLIIAHRLSTIQDADLIIVLDDGKIIETGNHNELIAKNGKYKSLYDTQFKGFSI